MILAKSSPRIDIIITLERREDAEMLMKSLRQRGVSSQAEDLAIYIGQVLEEHFPENVQK